MSGPNMSWRWNLWRSVGEGMMPRGNDAVTRYMKISLSQSAKFVVRERRLRLQGGGGPLLLWTVDVTGVESVE